MFNLLAFALAKRFFRQHARSDQKVFRPSALRIEQHTRRRAEFVHQHPGNELPQTPSRLRGGNHYAPPDCLREMTLTV
jgi:hypothetical protein